METDRRGLREAARERPEPREGRRRALLVIAADRVRDERLDVAGVQPQRRRRRRAAPRHGPAEALQRDPVEDRPSRRLGGLRSASSCSAGRLPSTRYGGARRRTTAGPARARGGAGHPRGRRRAYQARRRAPRARRREPRPCLPRSGRARRAAGRARCADRARRAARPADACRPGGERGAELRLERVEAPEDPALPPPGGPALVELGRPPELARLGVVANARARARAAGNRGVASSCDRGPLGVALVRREHRRPGDDGGGGHRQRGDDRVVRARGDTRSD